MRETDGSHPKVNETERQLQVCGRGHVQDMELGGGCGYLLENTCGLQPIMSTLRPNLFAVPTCRLNQAQKRKKKCNFPGLPESFTRCNNCF